MSNKHHLHYSMWTFCASMVFIKPTDDTACFSSNNDVTCAVEIGRLAFDLALAFVTLNVPNRSLMLPMATSSITFSSFANS